MPKNFHGKLEYTLDNGDSYSVFRDFSNKQIQVIDKNGEDVSFRYGIDKVQGSTFFSEQTNIDENLFISTGLVEQNQSRLNSEKQSDLIQRITNLLSTGNDNISYKNTVENLNKKLIEEVGTDRTSERPINLINKTISELQIEKDSFYHISEENLRKTSFPVWAN